MSSLPPSFLPQTTWKKMGAFFTALSEKGGGDVEVQRYTQVPYKNLTRKRKCLQQQLHSCGGGSILEVCRWEGTGEK